MQATFLRLKANEAFLPESPTEKQFAFLSLPHQEAFYGGAAGGGKSSALLMAALMYADQPSYAALLLRRTYGELSKPKALMDRARQWLSATEAIWNEKTHMWLFPSGATLSFGYLQNDGDLAQYQSAEFQYVGFDELTEFTERQYRFLFSRLRRLKENAAVPIRMRSASNPGGVGHAWVKQRFLVEGPAKGRPFIPARLEDNAHVDAEAYEGTLRELGGVDYARLRSGDWEISDAGSLAQRGWFPVVESVPEKAMRHRHWDLAATEKKLASDDPDYTVGCLMARHDGHYFVEHVLRQRVGPGAVADLILKTARMDGPRVSISLEQEPGASGKILAYSYVNMLSGFNARAMPCSGDKVTKAMPFLRQAEHGHVSLKRGTWNTDWLDEICGFPNLAHDDQVDGASGAFNALVQRQGAKVYTD